MTKLALAGISVRMLAEAAAADGFEVIALDLFGDADTRRVSSQWRGIGGASGLQIDGERLLAALVDLARCGDVQGWIAGSGFDGRPDLLARGAAVLPLVGTQADAMRRARDPQIFFGFLEEMRIAHPAVQMQVPDDAAGWLLKDSGACGGWHISHAAASAEAVVSRLESSENAPRDEQRGPPSSSQPDSQHYYQRQARGTPMSATFIANGRSAAVLGFNRLIVRRFGAHPYVYGGAIGPVRLPDRVEGHVIAAVRAVVEAFSLQGLGSLDFMLDGDAISVLEVNARPPASMSLYGKSSPDSKSRGIVAAHVKACCEGTLPSAPQASASRAVHGTDILFAIHRVTLADAAIDRLNAWPNCHDVPFAATRFEPGDPVCSVSAIVEQTDETKNECPAADRVQALLTERRHALRHFLETLP